ncbi:hypothetical protein [Halotalea alkalilenta]|uniref:hypothetical protein n=1 Tax=Halotalea alkalilenta TaxID=376489 RepID=UPI0012DC498A|nr:hypothetical protein [Halotalea alkalilenta]
MLYFSVNVGKRRCGHEKYRGIILRTESRWMGGIFLSACLLVLLSGELSNLYAYLVHAEGVNAGTYAIFLAATVCAALGIMGGWQRLNCIPGLTLVALLAFGVILALSYQLLYAPDPVLAIKASLSYFFIPFCALGAYAFHATSSRLSSQLFLVAGILLSSIGILQYLLGYAVGEGWLVLMGEEVLGFPPLGWVRPTALVGNSIIFAAVIFLFLVFSYQYYLSEGSWLSGLAVVMLASVQYLAMSRYALAATAGWCALLTILWFVLASDRRRYSTRLAIVVAITAFSCVVLTAYNSIAHHSVDPSFPTQTTSSNWLIVERFDSSAGLSQGSNEDHRAEALQAMEFIRSGEAPLGWGSQGISADSRIITDGLWFQFGIELGLWGAIAFVAWLVALAVAVIMTMRSAMREHGWRESRVMLVFGLTLVGYLIYSLVGGWVNSSLAGRVGYFFFWTMIGCFFGEASRLRRSSGAADEQL